MRKFKVGDKLVARDKQQKEVIYTIKALGEELDDGDQGAWVTSGHSTFGLIVNLKLMEHYFEPGFFQWRGWAGQDAHGPIKWYDTSMGLEDRGYVRVNVVLVEEEDDDV
jgi:hypothetical protein